MPSLSYLLQNSQLCHLFQEQDIDDLFDQLVADQDNQYTRLGNSFIL